MVVQEIAGPSLGLAEEATVGHFHLTERQKLASEGPIATPPCRRYRIPSHETVLNELLEWLLHLHGLLPPE